MPTSDGTATDMSEILKQNPVLVFCGASRATGRTLGPAPEVLTSATVARAAPILCIVLRKGLFKR
jgi:hypothetical protein